MTGQGQRQVHPIPPFVSRGSRILILGSFPSEASRRTGFFYGHPQNRFWKVCAAVFADAVPESVPEKKDFLARHHIALWDVIAACTIIGSSDSSIRDAVPNDIAQILREEPVEAVFCNGSTAWTLYEKHIRPQTGVEAVKLPSTSPANAAWSLEKLTEAWRQIRLRKGQI